jgi:serine O-acetyltransferase
MIRKLFYLIGQLFFLPHVILFLFSTNKNEIIGDVYARKDRQDGLLNHCYYLSLALLKSTYFRTLFYHRTRGFFTNILRIFYPKNNSFTIEINTKIGAGLQLAHPYSTILNANSIGNNVYVNHLVTLGEKNGAKPTIGNNVQLHAGCIVIGGITIGDNAIIGAGAVVVKDVPANAIAIGNPASIIEKN